MSVYLNPARKLVHDCKVDASLGLGMTRCGLIFVTGNPFYKPSGVFDEQLPSEDVENGWVKCKHCESGSFKKQHNRWYAWKRDMKRTLLSLGLIEEPQEAVA